VKGPKKKKSHVARGGVWGKREKKEDVREGGGDGGSPKRGGPHEIFATAIPSTMGILLRVILTKMAHPHMGTKIPIRVVDPLPPLRVVDPPPLLVYSENPLYEWRYLRAFP